MTTTAEQKVQYKNLYEMLDSFQYILANDAESHLELNEPMLMVLQDKNQEEADNSTLQEFIDNYSRADVWEKLKPTEKELQTLCKDLEREELREEVNDRVSDMDFCDIYQTFVVDKDGAKILADYGQLTWYNEDMDLHFWGVTHFGTAWSLVMDHNFPANNKEYYIKH
jgi:replicative superfamily II helicase